MSDSVPPRWDLNINANDTERSVIVSSAATISIPFTSQNTDASNPWVILIQKQKSVLPKLDVNINANDTERSVVVSSAATVSIPFTSQNIDASDPWVILIHKQKTADPPESQVSNTSGTPKNECPLCVCDKRLEQIYMILFLVLLGITVVFGIFLGIYFTKYTRLLQTNSTECRERPLKK
jgi:hypothetical protein